jgi:hypothetical protein
MLEKNALFIETVEACMSTIFPTSLLPIAFLSGPLAAAHARKISNCRVNVTRSLGRNRVGREAVRFAGFSGFRAFAGLEGGTTLGDSFFGACS